MDRAMNKVKTLWLVGAAYLMASATVSAGTWSALESRSPTDGSHQVGAALLVGDAALILRCREQTTQAAFSTVHTYLGDGSVTVRFRINSENPIKQVWRSSIDGRAAFAPNAEDFIRVLPDDGRVFIRAIAADGNNKDANFILSGLSEVRGNIARACNWTAPTDAVGAIHTLEQHQ
jgi:hypothetical protein